MDEKVEPQALQIVVSNDDNTITLNEEALFHILTKDEIKDRYVSIVSITGVFRQGKSFLLNFLLRYLNVMYVERRNVIDWLTCEDGPLRGFSWAPGSKRHTTGIHMWSEVFLTKLSTGEEVAIILLDTQGTFDNNSSVSDSATIFALSTLLSSVQIYNLMRNIKQYDLTHLQCFGGYGQLISKTGTTPFQNLVLLVRDWACPYEKPYGVVGGNQLLSEIFDNNDAFDVKTQASSIKELFSDVGCFLLPYPGRIVDTSRSFNGELEDVDEEFRKSVQEFVPMILSPQNLVIKTVHGEKIRSGDLVYYIKEYCNILKHGPLFSVETLYKATIEAHYKAAVFHAIKLYRKNMDCDCKFNPKCYSSKELYQRHSITKLKAVEHYGKIRKFEDPDFSDKYLIELKNDMDEIFKEYVTANENKIKAFEMEKKKRREQAEKIARRLDRYEPEAGSSSGMTTTINNVEKVGTAVAVIGGIAALAFGASKLFTSRSSNE